MINKLREEINVIDNEICRLFEKRMKLSLEIGEIKKKSGVPIAFPDREREIVNRLRNNVDDWCKDYVSELYNYIFAISKECQKRLWKD